MEFSKKKFRKLREVFEEAIVVITRDTEDKGGHLPQILHHYHHLKKLYTETNLLKDIEELERKKSIEILVLLAKVEKVGNPSMFRLAIEKTVNYIVKEFATVGELDSLLENPRRIEGYWRIEGYFDEQCRVAKKDLVLEEIKCIQNTKPLNEIVLMTTFEKKLEKMNDDELDSLLEHRQNIRDYFEMETRNKNERRTLYLVQQQPPGPAPLPPLPPHNT